MKKKLLSVLLATVLVASLAACGTAKKEESTGSSTTSTESSVAEESKETPPEGVEALKEERPVLRVIMPYTAADMANDPARLHMEEVTGYTVDYEVLPQDNPDQKLMLEVASGSDFDIIRATIGQFGMLRDQGALVDIAPYLEYYGTNIKNAGSEMGWSVTTTKEGEIFGMPYESNPSLADPYGIIHNGFGIRKDLLAEHDLTLPETLDEFKDFLTTINTETGQTPLTISGGTASVYVRPLLSAFGISSVEWYDVDGEYVPKIKMPELVEYLAYMQMLYAEGLLDQDFPINKTENTIEKLTSKKAHVTTLFFWDIPTVLSAFEAAGQDTGLEMIGALKKDENTRPTKYVAQGLYQVFSIPKSSENIADAINYCDIQAEPTNFLDTYLGVEGEQFEIREGRYYPLFPGFDDFANSKQFTGIPPAGEEFTYWQARARKTPEMAEAFESMNGKLVEMDTKLYIAAFGLGQAGTENKAALETMVGDRLIQAIVDGTDPQTAVDSMIGEWDSQGGLEYEGVMKTWYANTEIK